MEFLCNELTKEMILEQDAKLGAEDSVMTVEFDNMNHQMSIAYKYIKSDKPKTLTFYFVKTSENSCRLLGRKEMDKYYFKNPFARNIPIEDIIADYESVNDLFRSIIRFY